MEREAQTAVQSRSREKPQLTGALSPCSEILSCRAARIEHPVQGRARATTAALLASVPVSPPAHLKAPCN